MTQKSTQDQKEIQGRLQSILRGAFSGPPTPLKDIPKKSGESRHQAKKKPTASKKS
jgi:hypothetical protein